jgi:hypothetical protein
MYDRLVPCEVILENEFILVEPGNEAARSAVTADRSGTHESQLAALNAALATCVAVARHSYLG